MTGADPQAGGTGEKPGPGPAVGPEVAAVAGTAGPAEGTEVVAVAGTAGPAEGTEVAAAAVVRWLAQRRQTLAVAESVTGGLLAATVVDVPGASAVFRGGLVVYATDLKSSLAGVPAALLAGRGPVDPQVALALAEGARARCGADWGLATTGVAGPTPQDGVAVGTVHVAVAGPGHTEVRSLTLPGDRAGVRRAAVAAALALLLAPIKE